MIEWLTDKPDYLTPDRPVAAYVTILEDASPSKKLVEERGQRMAAALDQLAQTQGAITFLEPLQWEREMRQDRELPVRVNDADR